jgi:2'-5' RNA ligase
VARLFVAVVPPEGVLDAVAALPRPDADGLRWTTRDQWHVTLRFLGAVRDVDPVVSALAAMPFVRCEAMLGPAIDRFGRRVLHVPVTGLDALAAAVVSATADFGEPPEDRPFTAHLTIARARSRRGVDLRPFAGVPIAATWAVDEVAVVESHLHPQGARYEIVARR